MMLTTKGRYGVMAMADIAAYGVKNTPVRLGDVAGRQNIPLNYLEQIVANLKAAGLLQAVRGPGGGYRLSKAAKQIDLLSIVQAAEENITMTRCGHGNVGACASAGKCITHDLWHDLELHIRGFFADMCLADVASKPNIAQFQVGQA